MRVGQRPTQDQCARRKHEVKHTDDLQQDIKNLVLSIKLTGARSGFMDAASPVMIS